MTKQSTASLNSSRYPPRRKSSSRWTRLPKAPPNRLSHHRETWSESEDATLSQYYTSHGAAYTAAILGRTIVAVRSRARMHGIPGFETNVWDESEIETARRLFLKNGAHGCAARAIAQSLGRTARSVVGQLRRNGLKVREASAQWTARELQIVRRYYGRETVEEIGQRIGRTGPAILHQARTLGLKRCAPARPWTKQEEGQLAELWADGKDARRIADLLGRTKVDVVARIRRLHLQRKQQCAWTESEERLLRQLQPCLPYPEIARRLDRPVGAVRAHIHRLGLGKPNTARSWTKREDARLRRLFGTMTQLELGELFGRTAAAIGLRAAKLQLTKERARPWTAAEEKELKRLNRAGVDIEEIAQQLERTVTAINVRCALLGLHKRA